MTGAGTVIDGKYEILTQVGKGGMSYVYLARDKRLNKQWAIKEVKKTGNIKKDEVVVNSLIAEANMIKRLDHPSIVRIVDIIYSGETIYIVMDYIEGENLDKIIKEEGPQPEELVIAWAKQICDALGYLHSQRPPIIYRDMKPGNIMLRPDGNIKIIDFGIAREYKEQSLKDTTVLGTRGYAPPEQYSGQTDARSDIFAIGMTMHHLLTGVDPRKGEAYVPVRSLSPEVSEGVEMIIDKCVQPAPENRYQNCRDLLYDLEHPNLITKDHKRTQKRKLGMFVLSAALCLVTLFSGIICNLAATSINNNTYENLLGAVEDIESWKQAIEIYPGNTEAYLQILDYYLTDDNLDVDEAKEFETLYNRNLSEFDKSSEEFAELNYQAGIYYFIFYDNCDNFRACVQKAQQFFKSNHDNMTEEYEYKDISECYYQMCEYYTDVYSEKTEYTKSDYEKLLSELDDRIDECSELESNNTKISLYCCVFRIIYALVSRMAALEVSERTILDLFTKTYNKAIEIESSVLSSTYKKMYKQIFDYYESWYKNIEGYYDVTLEVEESSE